MSREGPAIGIDLGTTYSCVAFWKDNHVEIIANDHGQRTTPSWVAFTNDQRLIGVDAKRKEANNSRNTVFDVKRLIGRTFNDKCVQEDIKRWPFKVISGHQDKPMIVVRLKDDEKHFTAEEISSMVLIKMKETAETYLETTVMNVVITVPAYFDDAQRQATKIAGEIAGLNVMRIINEPTAAAFAYAFDKKTSLVGKKNLLIFDLGGGTFDVSVMTVEGETFEVKAVAGDTHLGGVDFDNRLLDYVAEEFRMKHGEDITGNDKALRKLKNACEKAKRDLLFFCQCTIDIDALHNGIDFSYSISRATFVDLNKDLFSKCMNIVEKCLENVKMEKSNIDRVILVGGSTRIPEIQNMIQEFFNGKEIYKSINQDEAVAYGAAIQAAILSGDEQLRNLVLRDVTPLSLGVGVEGDIVSVVVPRNTSIPCKKEEEFVTTQDNQTRMCIRVYEGERSKCIDNNLLGDFVISGIPPAPRRKGMSTVSFDIDANGILTVSAYCEASGTKNSIIITNEKNRLSEEEIKKMIADAKKYKFEDEEYKKRVAAENDLLNYLYSVKKSVAEDQISSLPPCTKQKNLDSVDSKLQCMSTNELPGITEFNKKKEELRLEINNVFEPVIAKESGNRRKKRSGVLKGLGTLVKGLHLAGAATGVGKQVRKKPDMH